MADDADELQDTVDRLAEAVTSLQNLPAPPPPKDLGFSFRTQAGSNQAEKASEMTAALIMSSLRVSLMEQVMCVY